MQDTKKFLIFTLLLFFTQSLLAKNLEWQDMKDFPPGAQIAIVSGNPSQPGAFTVRLKFPAHYIVPAHSHPTVARATVISGVYFVGTGNVADANIGKALHAGNSFVIPAQDKHYGFTKNGATLQVEATGPWDIVYASNG